jgi:hypothetical protein
MKEDKFMRNMRRTEDGGPSFLGKQPEKGEEGWEEEYENCEKEREEIVW